MMTDLSASHSRVATSFSLGKNLLRSLPWQETMHVSSPGMSTSSITTPCDSPSPSAWNSKKPSCSATPIHGRYLSFQILRFSLAQEKLNCETARGTCSQRRRRLIIEEAELVKLGPVQPALVGTDSISECNHVYELIIHGCFGWGDYSSPFGVGELCSHSAHIVALKKLAMLLVFWSNAAKFWWTGALEDIIANDSKMRFPSYNFFFWKLIHIRDKFVNFVQTYYDCKLHKEQIPAQQQKKTLFHVCICFFFAYTTYESILLWKFHWKVLYMYLCMYINF